MPIYEYRCAVCSHEEEFFQKMADAPLTHCPACGGETLEKMISATAFQLKGSGWYVTDFKTKKTAKPAEKTPTEKTEDAKENAVKTETKPTETVKESAKKTGE